MKKALCLLVLAATFFASCSKDEEKKNLSQQMIGKWMLTQVNGHIVPTNEKMVYTIESATQGYLSASRMDYTEEQENWANHVLSEIEPKYVVYHNGDTLYASSGTAMWSKVAKDYSTDILGKWAGRVTSSEGSEFDDGEPHQWEYLDDGNYVYYSLDADSNWTSDVNAMSHYFVDGPLLCTRWKNSGEGEVEHREWWEIASIENGVMNWTALRQNDDGSTYTATFSMTKVQ